VDAYGEAHNAHANNKDRLTMPTLSQQFYDTVKYYTLLTMEMSWFKTKAIMGGDLSAKVVPFSASATSSSTSSATSSATSSFVVTGSGGSGGGGGITMNSFEDLTTINNQRKANLKGSLDSVGNGTHNPSQHDSSNSNSTNNLPTKYYNNQQKSVFEAATLPKAVSLHPSRNNQSQTPSMNNNNNNKQVHKGTSLPTSIIMFRQEGDDEDEDALGMSPFNSSRDGGHTMTF
jgi:hypothetical protein